MQPMLAVAISVLASAALADEVGADDPSRRLIVGTKHSPPFAFKNPDGQWTGISIELWRHLTDELNLEYEFRELTMDEMLGGLQSGELDAAVAAISVTAERHQQVDFCHPHFTTGLGIAVRTGNGGNNWLLVRRIVSTRLLVIVTTMIAIATVCGMLFWVLERKHNTSMFGGGRRQGIETGIWLSTIVLLGHKGIVPVSARGRLVAACSMIASIFLLSLLTGVITSVLTVQQLETGIEHPSDLRNVRTLTVASSTSAEYLRRRRIAFNTRPTAEAVLTAIAESRADAAVYDEALLRYLSNNEFAEDIHVLSVSFNTQEYAIGLPKGSTLRRPLNEALLHYRATDSWDELVYRYLGADDSKP